MPVLSVVPGPSQGGDSIIPFLYSLVASLGASPLVAAGVDGVCHVERFGVSGIGLDSSLPLSSNPSSSSVCLLVLPSLWILLSPT